MILRGGIVKPFKISTLTDEQMKLVRECPDFQCGLTGWVAKYIIDVPNFFKGLFDFDCDKHDLGFRRGGGLLDFYESNKALVIRTHKSIYRFFMSSSLPYINRIFKTLILLISIWLMIVAIFTIGLFAFDWGKYKDFDEILEDANCKVA